MTKLVVLTALQRSGTHFLASALNRHPAVCFFSELLRYDYEESPELLQPELYWKEGVEPPFESFFFYHFLSKKVEEDPHYRQVQWLPRAFDEYLSDLIARVDDSCVGIDIKYSQLGAVPSLFEVLGKHRACFIHLLRDPVEILVSQVQRATHQQPPHSSEERSFFPQITLPVGPQLLDQLENFKRQQEKIGSLLQQTGQDLLTLHYADLGENNVLTEGTQGKLLEFLGLEHVEPLLESPLRRTGHADWRESLVNAEEVSSYLSKHWT